MAMHELGNRALKYNHRVTEAIQIKKVAEADFPTRWGHFRIIGFEGTTAGQKEEAVALVHGDIATPSSTPLVPVHSHCLTGDVFGSLRCGCPPQVGIALSMISGAGSGGLLYE